jgi:peptidyl-prolyl cis-trans isomerase SurA
MNVSFSMRNPFSVRLPSIAMLCLTFGMIGSAQAQFANTLPPTLPSMTTPDVKSVPAVRSTAPRTIDAIVAVINDDVITRQELTDRLAMVEKRLTSQGVALPPRSQLQSQLLERLILERAQAQMAKENGIVVDDTMLDRAVSRIAEQNKLTMPQFRIQLEREGIAFQAFREDIRREIIMQRLREREVDNKVQVSESEVDNYLAAQSNGAAAREEFNLSQILVRVPENASPQQIAARRERAEDVLRQLKSGGDFAKLAATYSDSSDALNGGDLGWRNQDRLPQLFLDAIANLKAGQVSAIVKSGNGFHILKVVDRRSAGANKDAAAAVQQTHARHILIKVNQVVSAAEAKRKLLELKDRLDHKAATFEELAKLYSNDLSASKGGDLGWIYPGDTVPEFERAMNELKIGEVSQPIESPFGYHLIQVLERKTDDGSKERARQAARQAIRERKIDEATEDWLRQLRDRTYVEFRNDDNG